MFEFELKCCCVWLRYYEYSKQIIASKVSAKSNEVKHHFVLKSVHVEMDTKGSLVKLLVFFLLDVHAQKGSHALIWCSANLS